MRSYQLYIDGQDYAGSGWSYVLPAREFIEDPVSTFALKRELELDERSCSDVPESVVARCAVAGDEANELALEAAARASKTFRCFSLEARRSIAEDFFASIADRAEEFVDILVTEGHPVTLARWEVEGILESGDPRSQDWNFGQCEQLIDDGERQLKLVRKPDGVVCLNPPQNAAGSNSALGVLALLAGNTLVVKAPRSTPLSVMFLYCDIVAPILERHGAPAGTLNIVSGSTKRILKMWLDSPLVDDIMFFGSSATGLKIGRDCVAKGKKPVLELAGNDGFVVWKDCNLETAAATLTECFYGSSQICMVPKYALVHPDVAEEFVDLMLERVSEIEPGYPDDPDTLLSPVLKSDRFFDFVAESTESGCSLLTGGRQVDIESEPSPLGLFLEPTLVRVEGLELAGKLKCVREETFFPLLPLVVPEAASDEDLLESIIDFVNSNEYGLRNSLWAADPSVIGEFTTAVVNGGQLKVNDSHIGFAPVLSTHGGTGRTGGPFGELNYPMLRTSHLQGVSICPPDNVPRAVNRLADTVVPRS